MAANEKLLERMRRNPRDWRMGDVASVCSGYGIEVAAPTGGGSHWKVKHPAVQTILTIPARRPIKPVYIRELVRFIEAVRGDDA